MRRRLPVWLVALAAVLGSLAPIGHSPPVRAAEPYTLATGARYHVQVEKRSVAVTVAVTFTNLTPDPAGSFSVFETVPLAVHDVAASVSARDARGSLALKVAMQKGSDGKPVNVATVKLRQALRYRKSAAFTLSYRLPDGKDPAIHVRAAVVTFPVWSFGTSSVVTVDLPAAYEVRADGDPLTAARSGDITTLSSGKIADPAHWLALLSADRETPMQTTSASVPLDGGTLDLKVNAWVDDVAWGSSTLAVLSGALPRLQKAIGLPYSGLGPLLVTEALPSSEAAIGEAQPGAQELQIAFDAPRFTVLHQAAHVWLGDQLIGQRWIGEGLASHYAAEVAGEMKVKPPYDPARQAGAAAKDAFPLEEWTADGTDAQGGYAYAAAWAFVDGLAGKVGDDTIRSVLQRAAAGMDAYEPVGDGAPRASGRPVTALDSRRLLDQLEALSGRGLGADFNATVFGAESRGLLPARAAARTAYAGLLRRAGDWGAPDPTRTAMAAWRYDEATPQIGAAQDWLADRDTLLAAVERAGLSAPQRLRDRYQSSGGGAEARDELNAERAVVTDYQAVLDRGSASRSLLQRIGLLGAQDPDVLLADAHGRFADGDLRGAADATSQARLRLDGAEASGLLRLASVVVVLLIALIVAFYLLRRRRTLLRHDG